MSSKRERGPDPRDVFRVARGLAASGETRSNWDDRHFVGISETPDGKKSRINIRHSKHTAGDSIHIDLEGEYRLAVYQSSFARDPEDEFRISSDFAIPSDLLDVLQKLKPDSAAHAQFREDRRGSAMARAIGVRSESTVSRPHSVLSQLFPLWPKRER
jgi:hypothetical protein